MRTLVVYFSKKGHVARVAGEIASALGADTERMIDKKYRGWPWSYIAANRDAVNAIPADISEPVRDPAGYDLVVVGTPVWKDRMSTPVLAYLKRFEGRFPAVAFFLTCAVDRKSVLEDMAAVAGKAPVATLVVMDGELETGKYAAGLQDFIGKLRS